MTPEDEIFLRKRISENWDKITDLFPYIKQAIRIVNHRDYFDKIMRIQEDFSLELCDLQERLINDLQDVITSSKGV
jgi:hypothetical protein